MGVDHSLSVTALERSFQVASHDLLVGLEINSVGWDQCSINMNWNRMENRGLCVQQGKHGSVNVYFGCTHIRVLVLGWEVGRVTVGCGLCPSPRC